MQKVVPLCLAVLVLAVPAVARAGSYHVYTCVAGGGVYANGAWTASTTSGVTVDTSCSGDFLELNVKAGARSTNNTSASLTFTSPANTTIADFSLTRQLTYNNPIAADTHRYYMLYLLGSTPFAGAGNYADATRDALNTQKQWYGHPEANASVAKSTVTRATFPALAAYTGNARTLILRVGCYNRGTPCSVNTGGSIRHILHGADVTVTDDTEPAVTVEASGLLSGGSPFGSDPVTLTATDNSGIAKVELLDVTDPNVPVTVGVEDYEVDQTDDSKSCDHSKAKPCPDLARETIRPTALPAGQRSLLVRVTDTGGNVVTRGPYSVFAVTASDRGLANGSNATDTGGLSVVWTKGGRDNRRTVSYGTKAGVRGRLTNAFGVPVAGAQVRLLSRDLRRGAPLVQRNTFTTDANGRFNATVTASASRLYQFSWLAYANDIRSAANGYLTLQARASAKLTTSTRRPRVGRNFTISGRLAGVSRGSVPIVVQGRRRGAKRWDTFADTTSSRTGRFRVRYRFRDSGSRGRTFQFRARIRPAARFPYETGYSKTLTVRVR